MEEQCNHAIPNHYALPIYIPWFHRLIITYNPHVWHPNHKVYVWKGKLNLLTLYNEVLDIWVLVLNKIGQ